MIEKEKFKSLTDKIIYSVYKDRKDQQLIYKEERDNLVDALYNDQALEENEVAISLEGGNTIKTILECVSMVIGTYKMIKEVYGVLKGNPNKKQSTFDINSLKETWMKKLAQEKVDTETATRIVEEFSVEANKLYNSY
jgi:hypothetical protein